MRVFGKITPKRISKKRDSFFVFKSLYGLITDNSSHMAIVHKNNICIYTIYTNIGVVKHISLLDGCKNVTNVLL